MYLIYYNTQNYNNQNPSALAIDTVNIINSKNKYKKYLNAQPSCTTSEEKH